MNGNPLLDVGFLLMIVVMLFGAHHIAHLFDQRGE
jgi:hypothetical protein